LSAKRQAPSAKRQAPSAKRKDPVPLPLTPSRFAAFVSQLSTLNYELSDFGHYQQICIPKSEV
jgi:hypothetical protein